MSIILLLILQNDLSYDKYHVNYKRIYRLGGHLQGTGVDERTARSARELGVILKAEFPELSTSLSLHLPDEKSKRVGQAVAAASLPQLK